MQFIGVRFYLENTQIIIYVLDVYNELITLYL